jgi:hypothetical protein
LQGFLRAQAETHDCRHAYGGSTLSCQENARRLAISEAPQLLANPLALTI